MRMCRSPSLGKKLLEHMKAARSSRSKISTGLLWTSHVLHISPAPPAIFPPIYNIIVSVAGRRPASGPSFLLCRSAQPTIIAFSLPTTFTTSCGLLVKIDYDTVFRFASKNTFGKLVFFIENPGLEKTHFSYNAFFPVLVIGQYRK